MVRRGILGLIAICAVIVVLALAGLAWDFLTGLEFNSNAAALSGGAGRGPSSDRRRKPPRCWLLPR